jgi:hypothetical protein
MEKLTLWTVRHRDEFYKLIRDGVLRADAERVDKDFRSAYEWMGEQLAKKVPPPSGCTYPLWAWWRWQGRQRPMPDLRSGAHLPKGTPGVRIEFKINLSDVLLSDFDAWHAVLNRHYYAPDEADYNKYLKKISGKDDSKINKINEQSWEKIFVYNLQDIDNLSSVQAVFWELYSSQIVDVKYFKAR